MWGCEDVKMWGCGDVKMWGCEDVKMSGLRPSGITFRFGYLRRYQGYAPP